MPLIEIWKHAPSSVSELSIQQVVAAAGDGQLSDGSTCSTELREYLSQVSLGKIAEYAKQCLAVKFEKSGQVLQDLVNEVGRRLGFTVENGLYAGKSNAIGNDGLWIAPEGNDVVVEVKTSDTYQISLSKIASYRTKLLAAGKIGKGSSILVIVGAQATGELEAQVRGSPFAWEIRLISVSSLLQLAQVKEDADNIETSRKVRSLLIPVEYTRIDALVDIVFAAVKETERSILGETDAIESEANSKVSTSSQPEDESESEKAGGKHAQIPIIRSKVLAAFCQKKHVALLKYSQALYWEEDQGIRLACTVSKPYPPDNHYWFAFHPKWDEFLTEGVQSYCALGCIELDRAFIIPHHFLQTQLPYLDQTIRPNRKYWHIRLKKGHLGEIHLSLSGQAPISLETFSIAI